jgi:hypothetical protein
MPVDLNICDYIMVIILKTMGIGLFIGHAICNVSIRIILDCDSRSWKCNIASTVAHAPKPVPSTFHPYDLHL